MKPATSRSGRVGAGMRRYSVHAGATLSSQPWPALNRSGGCIDYVIAAVCRGAQPGQDDDEGAEANETSPHELSNNPATESHKEEAPKEFPAFSPAGRGLELFRSALSQRETPLITTPMTDRPATDRWGGLGPAAPKRAQPAQCPLSTQGTSRASLLLLRLESALHVKAPGLPKEPRSVGLTRVGCAESPFAHHSTASQIGETLSRHDHSICCELWGQDQAANLSRQTQTWPLTQVWPEEGGGFHDSFPATTHSSEIITES